MKDPRTYTYTLPEIAKVSGVSLNTVYDHKQGGLLDPSSLLSVSMYVVSGWARKGLPDGENR